MLSNKKYHCVFSICVFFVCQYSAAAVSLTCTSKISGTWNFGTAPSACNVTPLMSQDSVQNQYSPVLFNDASEATAERKDFLSEMYLVLRDVGTSYLLRANPQVSNAELMGFLDGLYALAHQETFWTHYRLGKDQLIRYMRGDGDHGHGLMQVDDRSHVDALRDGRGVDLVYNIMYGLDVYYAAWVKSATSSCVSTSTNYKNRARSAWSAYNGGPGKICRWSSSPTSGDTGYLQKYNQRGWLKYVRDTGTAVALDVNCLMYNTRPCSLSEAPSPSPTPAPAPETPALRQLIGKIATLVAPNGINLRDLQTDKILVLIPKGTQVVIEDVSQKDSDIKTYMKVTHAGKTGSIYAGHEKPTLTRDSWVRVENSSDSNTLVQLTTARPYQMLRECAGYACAKSEVVVKGGSSPDALLVLQKENNWIKVQIQNTNQSGWIEATNLMEKTL